MKHVFWGVVVLLLLGCNVTTGEEALAQMNAGQRETVEALKQFSASTTIEDISGVFGTPSDLGVGGVNPTWKLKHEGKETAFRAYFLGGGLSKIQYMSVIPMWGYTIYYEDSGAQVGT